MKNYITPKGFERLQAEYNFLKKIERPKVCDIVSWAASLGDRSENADYQYGKKRLREIDKRMRFLAGRMGSAEVIDPEKQKASKIQFGATVTLEDEDGEVSIYSIVGVDESHVAKGRVSWKSPLGASMLGKEVGDTILVKAPGGHREYEVCSFEYREILIEEFEYASES